MTAPGGAGRTPLSAEAALSGRDVLVEMEEVGGVVAA
jgi:hypothetical protein